MSANEVAEVLLASFSSHVREIRKAAEVRLHELLRMPGAAGILLEVAAYSRTNGTIREVRQAAAIALKNLVKRRWSEHLQVQKANVHKEEDGRMPLFHDERQVILLRSQVLEALLCEQEPAVRDQLAEVVNEIAYLDFPDRWPELVPRLVQAISGRDSAGVAHGALLALRKLVKRYEFKSVEMRIPLEGIVESCFPLLRTMLQELVQACDAHAEAATLAKLILKIFWSCTQFALPSSFLNYAEQNILSWFVVIKRCLECGQRIPLQTMNTYDDIHTLEASPLWKLKKWAAQISARFLARYGRQKYVDEASQPFSKIFCMQCAPPLLESMLGLLSANSSNVFISSRVKQLAFTYLDSAVEIGSLYTLLRPHLDFILFDTALPALCATRRELEEFELDPREYIRRSHDPMTDFLDPRAAASNLICDLVRTRRNDVFQRLLDRLALVLQTYEQQHASNLGLELQAMVQKDGALCALGAIGEYLIESKNDRDESMKTTTKKGKKSKSAKSQAAATAALVDKILLHHVIPEINRIEPHNGFLRARACWVLQQFAPHLDKLSMERVEACSNAGLRGLEDPALPVRVEAAGAIRSLLAASDNPRVADILRPALPTILERCFQIMSDVGSDDVVQALEIVIDRFGDEIAPYAVALAQQLAQAFANYASVADDDDEAGLAAAQCVAAMAATLHSLDDNKDNVYGQIEPYLVPVLSQIFGSTQGEFIEYFEDSIEVLACLTYNGSTPFSPALWQLFEQLVEAVHVWAYDYIADLVAPFDNYISRDTTRFINGGYACMRLDNKNLRYIDAIVSVAERFLAPPENYLKACQRDSIKASYLILSILHHCPRGSVDDVAARYAWLCIEVMPVAFGPTPLNLLRTADQDDANVRGEIEATEISGESSGRPWRKSLANAVANVWASVLYYSPSIGLDVLARHQKCNEMISTWFELIFSPPVDTDTGTGISPLTAKLAILAISSIFIQNAASAAPIPLVSALEPRLLQYLVEFVDPDPDEEDEDDDNPDLEDEDDDDFNIHESPDVNFFEDVDDPEEDAYFSAIQDRGLRDVISTIDLEDDAACDEAVYCSPIDDQDENFIALDALKLLHQQGRLESLAANLSPELQEELQKFIASTEQRFQRHTERAALKAQQQQHS